MSSASEWIATTAAIAIIAISAVIAYSGPCSWTIPADFFWNTYRQVVVQGALAALAAGLATLRVLALLRRHEPAEGLRPAGAAG
jgi:hypothetical protein